MYLPITLTSRTFTQLTTFVRQLHQLFMTFAHLAFSPSSVAGLNVNRTLAVTVLRIFAATVIAVLRIYADRDGTEVGVLINLEDSLGSQSSPLAATPDPKLTQAVVEGCRCHPLVGTLVHNVFELELCGSFLQHAMLHVASGSATIICGTGT